MNVHGGDFRRHRYPGDSNIPYGISEMVIYDPAVPAVLTVRGRGSQVLRRHRQYKECSAPSRAPGGGTSLWRFLCTGSRPEEPPRGCV